MHLRDEYPAVDLVEGQPLAEAIYDDDQNGNAKPLDVELPLGANEPPIVATIADGIVAAPWCYLLSGDRLIWDSVDVAGRQHQRARAAYPRVLKAAHRAAPEDRDVALVGSQRLHGYWHWWVDVIPRMWLLERLKPGLPYILPPLQHSWQAETLSLLGLHDRVLTLESGVHRYTTVAFTRGVTGFRSRYPSPLLGEFSTWLRRAAGVAQPSGLMLYVRRPPDTKRGVANEPEVIDYLGSIGFLCIDPGSLTLREQIKLFADAAVVVGPHGGGLTTLLFSAGGTRVVELFSAEGAQSCSCYRTLASRLGQPYSRVTFKTGRRRRPSPHNDEMIVEVDRLADALRASVPQ